MKRDSIRSFVFALTFATASWLGTSAAAAQSLAEPRTWTVTPFLHTSLGEGIPDVDALDSLLESSVGVGVGVGYDLTHNLGFEGEIAHSFDVAPVVRYRPAENVVVPISRRLQLVQLSERTCKWPNGDPLTEEFSFCGNDTAETGPYCTFHSKVAFQPAAERRRR